MNGENGFWKKTMSVLGLEPTEYDEYDGESGFRSNTDQKDYPVERRVEREPINRYNSQPPRPHEFSVPDPDRKRSKVLAMPSSSQHSMNRDHNRAVQMTLMIFRPTSYEETQSVIDHLKCKRPIIMNLDEIDVKLAQRILDFVSGAVYALGGEIRKAARNIFVLAPADVAVASDEREEFGYDTNEKFGRESGYGRERDYGYEYEQAAGYRR